MKTALYKLTHDEDGRFLNPLIHVFFYTTFVFGFFFTFANHLDSVQESALYHHTQLAFGTVPLPIWGVCAMLVTAVNTYGLYRDKLKTIGWAALGGFCVWLFSAFIYLQDGLWFQFLVGSVPNLFFWGWYYLRVRWYYVLPSHNGRK